MKNIKEKYLNLNGMTEKNLGFDWARETNERGNDYSSADKIREILTNKGILIKDTREGTDWNIEISPKKIEILKK